MNPTEIDAIQARWDVAQKTLANDPSMVSIRQIHRLNESANDVPALVAIVREQQAQIERVRAMADDMATRTPNVPEYDLGLIRLVAGQFRAALTATEGT